MKKIYLFSIALIGAFTMQAQDCSNLFISEYVDQTMRSQDGVMVGKFLKQSYLRVQLLLENLSLLELIKETLMEKVLMLLYGMDGTIIPTVQPLYQTASIQLMKT